MRPDRLHPDDGAAVAHPESSRLPALQGLHLLLEKRIVERWTHYEISFVTIPADPGAQVRSIDLAARYPVSIEMIGATAAALARMQMRGRHLGA